MDCYEHAGYIYPNPYVSACIGVHLWGSNSPWLIARLTSFMTKIIFLRIQFYTPGGVSVSGKRAIGALASTQKGATTTGVHCYSALGHFIPPLLFFKRITSVFDVMKNGAPAGSIFGNSKSGWIDKTCLSNGFITSSKSSTQRQTPEKKCLLLLDAK